MLEENINMCNYDEYDFKILIKNKSKKFLILKINELNEIFALFKIKLTLKK